jgi:RNA-binding protein 4
LDTLNNVTTTKLYVTNLPDNCDSSELKCLFEKYGNVLECVIMWNQYAFVHFSDIEEAKIALQHIHGQYFNGKQLLVQLSTSSNRPLPKCLAFNKNTSKQQNNNNTNSSEEVSLVFE